MKRKAFGGRNFNLIGGGLNTNEVIEERGSFSSFEGRPWGFAGEENH